MIEGRLSFIVEGDGLWRKLNHIQRSKEGLRKVIWHFLPFFHIVLHFQNNSTLPFKILDDPLLTKSNTGVSKKCGVENTLQS